MDPGQNLNLEQMERRYILQALDLMNENRTEAAKVLGISRRTLQRKLKDFELG
jgi:transcriptional regulator with PAS, ATPase and Fis domain